MNYISKHFNTVRQAENYLQRLYDRFNYARLISWPRYEVGIYTFEVQN